MPGKYNKKSANQYLVKDILDKYIFIVFFLAGALSVIAVKALTGSMAIAIIVPVLLMLLYAYLLINHPSWRVREDRAGDNVYYLGFLYTMTSLSVALYRFSSEEGMSDEIVSNFGIALCTTIVGIAVRVVFQQMRTDLGDIEEVARLELADSVLELKIKLQDSIEGFDSFQIQMKSKVEDVITETTDVFKNEINKSFSAISDATKSLEDEIQGAAGSINNSISDLNNNSTVLVESLSGLVSKLNNVDIPPDIIESKISPLAESMSQIINQLSNEVVQYGVSQDQLNKKLEKLSESIKRIGRKSENISNVTEMLKTLGDSTTCLNQKVVNLSENYQDVIVNNEKLLKITDEEIKARNEYSSQLQAEYKSSLGELKKYKEVLSNEISEINSVSSKFSSAITKLASALASGLR